MEKVERNKEQKSPIRVFNQIGSAVMFVITLPAAAWNYFVSLFKQDGL